MRLRTAAVDALTDDGEKIGGPYFLPLDAEARRELLRLEREFGPIEKPTKTKE